MADACQSRSVIPTSRERATATRESTSGCNRRTRLCRPLPGGDLQRKRVAWGSRWGSDATCAAAGLSRRQAAYALGIDPATLTRLRQGRRPDADTIVAL